MVHDERRILDMLRSVRHDWLNQLQLLKTNIALNRMDRAEILIEDIVSRAKNEAKLSNINTPKLAVYLLSYNWQAHHFKLDIEVTGDDVDWSAQDDIYYDLIKGIFTVFEQISDRFGDNYVTLSIDTNVGVSTVTIDYSGKLTNPDVLNQHIIKLNQTYHLVEKYIQEEEAVISIQLTDHLR